MNISRDGAVRTGQIAVVEELPDSIYSIRFILESLGYKVGSVSCQSDYLDQIRNLAPRLIVVDMLIPAQGGLTAISELKSSDLRDVPTMAITADAVTLGEKELLEAGFDDLLSKPYTVNQLQKKLDGYVA